ncbi:MAG: iron donor protein CyaY [Burkholderiaceae bacterium]|jgi:CyaY protein|nr:iron donor protein CyaY [Burkholderiaceae bacterium]
MTDLEYMDRAERLLNQIERDCDRLNDQADVDIDNQRAGGMVTLLFPDGGQIVVNLQKPLHEVWLAARAGGLHFRYADGCWRDTKTGENFYACLSRAASAQAGRALQFGDREVKS